ncbi:MAG TPA: aldehyde dehydrogenase [Baekduia sp.]|nr:aldehyde dehydrogenase [Baekduia sp.]
MSKLTVEQPLLIGGEWVGAASGRTYERTDPFTGEVVSVAAAAGRGDAARAAEAAEAASATWAATPAPERADCLNNAADLLDERAQEITETMIAECGATLGWAGFNCALAAGMLRHAASLTGQVDEETAIGSQVPGLTARAVRQPVGVVVGIAPWNAPVILGTRAVATPLAFGNTVILKASEQCPRTHAAIVRAIADAGVPAGVISLVTNEPTDAADVVDELIAHPAVKRINFTGSTRIGKIIAQKAAVHLKRTLLELGGKAPLIVLADADLDDAAAAANFGAFMNSGQICMSTERIVVDRSVESDFEDRLVQRAQSLTVGDPRDPDTTIGPVVNEAAAARVKELLDDAQAKGARLLTGGDADGLLVTPTVVAGVTPEMRLYGEESFGPIVAVLTADGDEDAVRLANDTAYGLSAAVFSTDIARAEAVARRIQSGICHINGATVHDEPQMPFGGVKDSGWGRFGGDAALDEFTELRWLTVQHGDRHYPI